MKYFFYAAISLFSAQSFSACLISVDDVESIGCYDASGDDTYAVIKKALELKKYTIVPEGQAVDQLRVDAACVHYDGIPTSMTSEIYVKIHSGVTETSFYGSGTARSYEAADLKALKTAMKKLPRCQL